MGEAGRLTNKSQISPGSHLGDRLSVDMLICGARDTAKPTTQPRCLWGQGWVSAWPWLAPSLPMHCAASRVQLQERTPESWTLTQGQTTPAGPVLVPLFLLQGGNTVILLSLLPPLDKQLITPVFSGSSESIASRV